MKRLSIFLLATLLILGPLTGCSKKTIEKRGEYKNSLTYSNLVDLESQDEVRKAMELAEIPKSTIDLFFKDVNYFNETIEEKDLVKEKFTSVDKLEPEYDFYGIQDIWDLNSPDFIGYNCRITSFDLVKDLIQIEKINTEKSDWLIFDEQAIESSPRDLFNQEELEEFRSLYSHIATEDTKDISTHVNNVKKNWGDKGIKFPDTDKRSLISVFFHDEGGYLFIGHIGVLLPAEDGKLLFIEKLAFQAPYQAIKFDNRLDLNDYLMNKYDMSWGQPTAKPFIMENDQLLEGYRENPNNIEND